MITKTKYLRYLALQFMGYTNMLDIPRVKNITGLSQEVILEIQRNYQNYWTEYFGNNTRSDQFIFQEIVKAIPLKDKDLIEELFDIEVEFLPNNILTKTLLNKLQRTIRYTVESTHILTKAAEEWNKKEIKVPHYIVEAYNHLMIASKYLCCIPSDLQQEK